MRAVEIITEDTRMRGQAGVRFQSEQNQNASMQPVAPQQMTTLNGYTSRAPRVSEEPRLAAVAEVDDEFPIRFPNRRRKKTGPPPPSAATAISSSPAPIHASPFTSNRPTTIDLSDEGSISSLAGSTAKPKGAKDALDLSRPSLSSFDEAASQTHSDSSSQARAGKTGKRPPLGMSRFVGAMRKTNRSGSLPTPGNASSSSESISSTDDKARPAVRKKMSFDSLRITSRDFWRAKPTQTDGKRPQKDAEVVKGLPAPPPTRQAMPSMTEAFAPTFSDGYSFYHPMHTYDTHRDETLQKSFAALPRDARSSFAAVVESVLEQKIPEAERRVPLGARAKLKSWAQTARAKSQAQARAQGETQLRASKTPSRSSTMARCDAENTMTHDSYVTDVVWVDRDGKIITDGAEMSFGGRIGAKSKKYCEKWKITGDLADNMTDEELAYTQEALRSLLYPPPPSSIEQDAPVLHAPPPSLRRTGSLRRKPSKKQYHVGGAHAHHVERRPSRRRQQHDPEGVSKTRALDAGTKRRGGILDPTAETRLNMALEMARARLEIELTAQQERRMTRRQTRQQQQLQHKSKRRSSLLYGAPTPAQSSFAVGNRPTTRDRSYSASNYGDGASDAGSWADEEDDDSEGSDAIRYGRDETSPYLEENSMDQQLHADGPAYLGIEEQPASASAYDMMLVDADDMGSEASSPTLENDRAWLDEAYEEAVRKEAAFSNFCAHHPTHLGGAW